MNKKCLKSIVLMMQLCFFVSSFSMGGKKLVLSAAKAIGAGTGIGLVLLKAKKNYDDYNRFYCALDEPGNISDVLLKDFQQQLGFTEEMPLPVTVEQFARKRMEELHVPNAQSMRILCKPCGGWEAIGDKALVIGHDKAMELDESLRNRPLFLKEYDTMKSKREHAIGKFIEEETIAHDERLGELKKLIDQSDEVIALDSISLGHEASHLINDDNRKIRNASVIIAVGVQVISSTISCTFNKICGIKDPATWSRTIMRSSIAIGSIVPKLMAIAAGSQMYERYVEARADKFACENAQSLAELQAFRNYFQRKENDLLKDAKGSRELAEDLHFSKDPKHPYPGDRVASIQKHIYGWKEDHKE